MNYPHQPPISEPAVEQLRQLRLGCRQPAAAHECGAPGGRTSPSVNVGARNDRCRPIVFATAQSSEATTDAVNNAFDGRRCQVQWFHDIDPRGWTRLRKDRRTPVEIRTTPADPTGPTLRVSGLCNLVGRPDHQRSAQIDTCGNVLEVRFSLAQRRSNSHWNRAGRDPTSTAHIGMSR
jgi:hypothetical protein